MNIAEVLTMPKGTPVQDLVVTIDRAYDVRTGEGQYGPWRVMDFDAHDSTGVIKGQWWKPMVEDAPSMQGCCVRINATEIKKDKLGGAEVRRDTYRGEERVRISVTGDHLQITTAQEPDQATAQQPSSTAIRNGRLSVSDVLAVASRANDAFREMLGTEDTSAVAACINTVLIAVTQGRVDVDECEDSPF